MKINGKIKLILFSACLPVLIFGQDASTAARSLSSKLESYRAANPFEELWLHTDRETYVAGETVRVKAYLLSCPDLTVSKKNSYAYVELLDWYNNPVARITLQLVQGTGESDFLLPDSLVTGSYLLRAYTNLMKNYMPHGCFMKKITVANPFREEYLDFYTSLKFSHDPPVKVFFFPEGGKLISGLPTTVGVTVLNQYGYPAGCTASVTNGDGEIIAEVTVDTTGIGSFDFIADQGENYFFIISGTGQRFSIPPASVSGFNMRVSLSGSKTVTILLREKGREEGKPNAGGFILIQSRGKILFTAELPPWSTGYEIQVPADRMADGTNNIAIFDQEGNFLAERFFFMPATETENLHLSYSNHAGRRSEITIGVQDPQNRISNDDEPAGSIAVASFVTTERFLSASDYLLLGSEFSYIPEAPRLKDIFPFLAPEARNIFLLGIKSVWLDWEKITSGRWDPPLFPEEVNGSYLCVSLAGPQKRDADTRLTAFLVGWGRRQSFQYAENDTAGRFLFFLEDINETDEIIIRTDDRENYHPLRMESRFSDKYPAKVFRPDTTALPAIMSELDKLATRFQVRKIYGIPDSRESDTTKNDREQGWRFYGVPDQEIRLDDYISLSSMKEIFFELVRRLAVRSDRKDGAAVIWDPVLKRSPALFVDLVPVDDPEAILSLDPSHVRQIDIISGDYLFGDLVFPGILNVMTRKGNFTESRLPPNTLRSPFRMADKPSRFLSPDHVSGENNRIPDLRNTLFWNGDFKGGGDGDLSAGFRSSDDSQLCVITVNLIDREGNIISAREKILLTGN
ncbi:MAG: hypothetical protein WAV93_06025 [Bacteroidales bacterium]